MLSAAGAWWPYLLLLTASVLLSSGGLKLVDRAAFARAVDDFEVLPLAVRPLAKRVLPLGEIGLGLLLLLSTGALWRYVAWAVVVLLAGFAALVAVTLARGDRPSCRCFGALSAARISWWTLGRDLVMTGLAVVVAWGPNRPSDLTSGIVTSWRAIGDDARSQLATLVLFSLAVVALWIRQDRLRQTATPGAEAAVAGVPAQPGSLASTPIPALDLTSPDGERVSMTEMAAEQAQLLVFVSPTCATCHQLTPLVPDWQELLGSELGVRLVSIAGRDETAATYPHQVDQMWFDPDRAHLELGVPGTPSAVLLGNNGTIGAGPAAGLTAIHELLATIVQALGVNLMTGTSQHHPGADVAAGSGSGAPTREEQAAWLPAPGTPLAELSVVDADGTVTTYPDALAALAEAAGVETLTTLAWRHDCGFCEEILDDVRRLSAEGRVVLVVSEDPATVRAQGLTGPVLQVLPPATAVEAVGVPGTPAAVPVTGGVVSGLGGVGGPHVLEVLAEHSAVVAAT